MKVWTTDSHSVELAVVIGKNGRDISMKDSDSHIGGYGMCFAIHVSALAIDMTARNMQEKAKKSGLPWSAAKGLDTFTPIRYASWLTSSDLIAKDQIPDPHNVDLWLQVNGEMRQNGNTKDMIFSIPELIAYVSSIMTLETGDVLLTGMSFVHLHFRHTKGRESNSGWGQGRRWATQCRLTHNPYGTTSLGEKPHW